jgi:hypothetical protein
MYTIPFHTIDWSAVPATRHAGETGYALWHTREYGDLRVRLVEYSPGYRADHWCERGHILFCLEGELDTELGDGSTVRLHPGMSYQVSDGLSRHRSTTTTGAKLFIVDGGFLRESTTATEPPHTPTA